MKLEIFIVFPRFAAERVRALGIFRHVKAQINLDRHEMGRFVLTGSQAFNLMKGASDSLAGRCAILELENLSAAELVAADAIESVASARARLITRGQFPELWRELSIPARDYYASYVAARSGSILNKSDVAKDVGVSMKVIGDWLSVLQASGQIVLLEPSPFLGSLWETYVFAEMRKLESARGRGALRGDGRDEGGKRLHRAPRDAGADRRGIRARRAGGRLRSGIPGLVSDR